MDHSLWSGVAGGSEVVAVSLHADGLQPVLHCAHGRGRLGASRLQQGSVRPSGWRREKWRINFINVSVLGPADAISNGSWVWYLESVIHAPGTSVQHISFSQQPQCVQQPMQIDNEIYILFKCFGIEI